MHAFARCIPKQKVPASRYSFTTDQQIAPAANQSIELNCNGTTLEFAGAPPYFVLSQNTTVTLINCSTVALDSGVVIPGRTNAASNSSAPAATTAADPGLQLEAGPVGGTTPLPPLGDAPLRNPPLGDASLAMGPGIGSQAGLAITKLVVWPTNPGVSDAGSGSALQFRGGTMQLTCPVRDAALAHCKLVHAVLSARSAADAVCVSSCELDPPFGLALGPD